MTANITIGKLAYHAGRTLFIAFALIGAVMSGEGAIQLLGAPVWLGYGFSIFSIIVVLWVTSGQAFKGLLESGEQ